MKLTLERNNLSHALGIVSRAVSSRNSLPILSNVLLETDTDTLKLTATDLDTAFHVVIPAHINSDSGGAVAVSAALLTEIVSKLPDAPITLESRDGKVKVRSGKSDYTLLALPAEDYPVTPEVTDGDSFQMPQRELKRMLQMTTFAASKEETRSILMGVLFELDNDTHCLHLVATDTHRLAKSHSLIDTLHVKSASTIVPAKPLNELARVLSDTDEPVTVRFNADRSQVQFETADVRIVSRVLDGQFPNYEKVIPKTPERRVTFNRAGMLSALRRVFIVAKQNNEKAVFTFKSDLAEIRAESSDVGNALEEINVVLEGDELTIGFNAKYLIEVLSLMNDDTVALSMGGSLQPGVLRGDGVDDGFLFVQMPMQV